MRELEIKSEIIELEYARFYRTKKDVIVSEYTKPIKLDIEISKEVNKITGELCNHKPSNQLFIACIGMEADRETRKWGLTEEASQYTLKSAIVCDSLAHRIIGNVLINMKGFPSPTKMFADIETAVKWLNK